MSEKDQQDVSSTTNRAAETAAAYTIQSTASSDKIEIKTEPVPLEIDSDGVVRIGGTRVTLDTVVTAFNEGATAEEIVQQYPSLHLADVYAVISYYLRRQPEVKAYLRQRRAQADEVRKQNETRFDPYGVRDRLLARRANQKN
jgi:uncharacterized protein (DUF433 family)